MFDFRSSFDQSQTFQMISRLRSIDSVKIFTLTVLYGLSTNFFFFYKCYASLFYACFISCLTKSWPFLCPYCVIIYSFMSLLKCIISSFFQILVLVMCHLFKGELFDKTCLFYFSWPPPAFLLEWLLMLFMYDRIFGLELDIHIILWECSYYHTVGG
jgi:hypothetical protein